MMVGGIVTATIGGLALIAGSVLGAQTCPSDCSDIVIVDATLLIGGIVGLAVGIPLAVIGAKKVPAGKGGTAPQASAIPAWIGAPTARGWVWRF